MMWSFVKLLTFGLCIANSDKLWIQFKLVPNSCDKDLHTSKIFVLISFANLGMAWKCKM
jgi:hypothetical protein